MSKFDGATYSEERDGNRLSRQLKLVKFLMLDGRWRTLGEIVMAIGAVSEAGVSARLRDLRKEKFGSYTVDRRRRIINGKTGGLHEYRVREPQDED